MKTEKIIKRFIERNFTKLPYYDTSRDEIKNCEEGTLNYFHEQGHQKWYKAGIEQMIYCWIDFFIVLLIPLPFFKLYPDNYLLKLFVLIPLILFLISEIHAWIFAYKKNSKGDKK